MADQAAGLLSPWLRNRRIRKITPYLRGNILDFGCGVGALAQLCAPDHYTGVDIDGPSINAARIQNHQHRFYTSVPEDERFDSIVMLAVMEHLKNPSDILCQMRALLTPDGRIIITTPHPLAERIHYLGAQMRLFGAIANEEHEMLIDFNCMRGFAERADFGICKYERFLFGINQLFILKPHGYSASTL